MTDDVAEDTKPAKPRRLIFRCPCGVEHKPPLRLDWVAASKELGALGWRLVNKVIAGSAKPGFEMHAGYRLFCGKCA